MKRWHILKTTFLLFACVSVQAAEPLLWAGCGITKKAFMAELAVAFEKQTGTKIVLEGGGAAKGIRRASDNTVALGGTCRPKLPENPAEIRARLNPVAWDALTVIAHPSNTVENITLDQLKAIYEGKITNWRTLGGSNAPIDLLIRRGKHSGVGRMLRDLVFHDFDKVFISNKVYKSSGPLEEAVEKNPNAIAVTGISSAKKRQVKLMSLNNKQPNYNNIRSGAYLLYRPLYITTNPTHPRHSEVKKFIEFAHSRVGRNIIRRAGSVPYLNALNLIRHQREQWQDAKGLR